MNSTNHERLLLHIEAPDGTRKDSIELRLEGWEVSGSGARVSFPWKKLMTTVLTRILEIWAIPLPSEVVGDDDLPLPPPPVNSLLDGWFTPKP